MPSNLSSDQFDGSRVIASFGSVIFYSRAAYPEIPDCQSILTAETSNADGSLDQHIFAVPHGMKLPKFLETDATYKFPVEPKTVKTMKGPGRYRIKYIWSLIAEPTSA
ncbi:MAG: hypothetical protein ABL907_00405 [Hyphomicrobium sp.]